MCQGQNHQQCNEVILKHQQYPLIQDNDIGRHCCKIKREREREGGREREKEREREVDQSSFWSCLAPIDLNKKTLI